MYSNSFHFSEFSLLLTQDDKDKDEDNRANDTGYDDHDHDDDDVVDGESKCSSRKELMLIFDITL